MDYRDWMILKTIKDELNLTKAAQRLFISQPALTYRLANLEKELGVRLLHRHSSGVYFTPQGEYLLGYALKMLEEWDQVKEYVRHMDDTVQGTLRLGVSSVIAKFKMAPLLKSFKKKFPHVEFVLTTGSSTLQLPAMLKNRQIDIAIARGEAPWSEGSHIIAEEPMCILYSQPIDLSALADLPWIRYAASAITGSEEQVEAWWHEQFGTTLPTIVKVDSIEACIQMVSHGLGWCIVPRLHIKNIRSLFSCPVVWADGRTMLRKTVMLYSFTTAGSAAGRLFIDHVLREYS